MAKQTCYYHFYCGYCGEACLFFDAKFKEIHSFDCNDAVYRSEYMNPLFAHFGITMKPLPQKQVAKAESAYEAYING